jgi:hypothetical protein
MKKQCMSGFSTVSSQTFLHPLIPSILVGLVCFFFLCETQFSFPNFFDADSYYHTRFAQTIPQRGISKTFPWTQFSIWKDGFADREFLFHLYLLPFCHEKENLVRGGKLAALVLACAVFAVFFLIVFQNCLVAPYMWPFFLLVSCSVFQLRLLAVRPQFFGVLFAMLTVNSFINNRRKSLFLCCLLWPLSHSSFPLALVFGVIILLSGFDRKKGIKLLVCSIAGTALGFVLNPYFPGNLSIVWIQVIRVLQNTLGVNSKMPRIFGTEFAPLSLEELWSAAGIVVIMFFVGLVGVLIIRLLENRKFDEKIISLFWISVFFFICTLLWRRFIEFWTPFVILFFGFFFSRLLEIEGVRKILEKKIIKIPMVVTVLFLMTILLLVRKKDIVDQFKTARRTNPQVIMPVFRSGAKWIQRNIEPRQTIFHPSWGEFCQLYFFNQDHYYIIGLDPACFYYYNDDLFDLWYRIYQGKVPNVYESVRYRFGAKVFFFPKLSVLSKLYFQIQDDKRFVKKYEDRYCLIFQLAE